MEILIDEKSIDIKDLFVTNVGSHIWKMNHEESDIDQYIGYITPTSDILTGPMFLPRSRCQHGIDSGDGIRTVDIAVHEIGAIVHELLDGNITHLVGVLSPIVIKDWEHLDELKLLTMANLSKKCYKSIHGMAMRNYKKYVVTKKDDSEKRCNTIARVINFGISLLCEGVIEFHPVKGYSPENIPSLIETLDIAYKNSILPEEPQKYEAMIEWLLSIRMEELVAERNNIYC